MINEDKFYKKFLEGSRKWLADYIKDNHLKSCVIGISGGIDSTVSATIASPVCKELGIPLIGRSLPTGTNKEEETDTAILVGEAFCDDFKEVNIYDLCENTIMEFQINEGTLTPLQKGNVKARIRMNYLRNVAALHRGVVLDNDNFTEWNLGFWTVGGDSPMDINLGLHYLWKTEVYELARYLHKTYLIVEDGKAYYPSKESNAILESIKITPTDGNGVSNSDCDQFGLENYNQVDDVLKTMYYSCYPNSIRTLSKEDMNKEYTRLIDSYNEQGVDKVMVLHQNTEYKRKPSPIMPAKSDLI